MAAVWGPYYVSNDTLGHCSDRRIAPDQRIPECIAAFRTPRLSLYGAYIVFLSLADAYQAEYDFKNAAAVYDQALKFARHEDVQFLLYLDGMTLLGEDLDDEATAKFTDAAKAGGQDYALAGLGEIAARKGQFADAISFYTKALALSDNNDNFMDRLAWLYTRMGDYKNAMKIDDELVADLRLYPFPWAERCWHRAVMNRDSDLALADCEQALGMLPDDPSILDSRGLVHFRQGRWDDAIADYDAAISHNPRYASSLFMRGVSKLRKGETDEGDKDIAAAEAIYPRISAEYASYGITP